MPRANRSAATTLASRKQRNYHPGLLEVVRVQVGGTVFVSITP